MSSVMNPDWTLDRTTKRDFGPCDVGASEPFCRSYVLILITPLPALVITEFSSSSVSYLHSRSSLDCITFAAPLDIGPDSTIISSPASFLPLFALLWPTRSDPDVSV